MSSSNRILSAAELFQEQGDFEGIIAMIRGADSWHKIRPVRNPIAPRGGLHGRSVSRPRHQAAAHGSDYSPARSSVFESGIACALRAGSEIYLCTATSQHLRDS